MDNIFFVHTPLQLMVAQQIINQEKLEHNLLLYSYVYESKHVLKVYDLMRIDDLWEDRLFFMHLNDWASIRLKYIIPDLFSCLHNYKKIRKILHETNASHVYLSDINNISYKFTAQLLSKKKIDVSFFEDGSSHYIEKKLAVPGPKIILRTLAFLLDTFYFYPIWNIKFAKYMFCENLKHIQVPMVSRYSLIPFYNESFDILLHYTPLMSQKMKAYLDSELAKYGSKDLTLFLTSPVYEDVASSDSTVYIKTIRDFVDEYDKSDMLVIKFHPREREKDKELILSILKEKGVNYSVMSEQYSLPVESYLSYFKFKKIYTFYSSTVLYNGFLYPHVEFVFLYNTLLNNCKKSNVGNIGLLEGVIADFEHCMDVMRSKEKTVI